MQNISEIQIKNRYVDKFLKKTIKRHLIKIYAVFETIEKLGIEQHLKTQDIKKIKGRKEDLYELKVKTDIEYRFLGAIEDNTFLIVHAFKKKTQKNIKNEIDLAIKRLEN